MIKKSISIKNIPIKVHYKIIKYIYKNITIVGYMNINHNIKIPIIEFQDYTRIWILPDEINQVV
uniref:Cytochrome b6-f complex subunit PetP n=1 Tax=Plumaria plumosa TaxID=189642 RepID=A0A4D6X2L9_9FLOR|nr:cytochrome b6-f complex subunit PetP [Plumaria plumosa]